MLREGWAVWGAGGSGALARLAPCPLPGLAVAGDSRGNASAVSPVLPGTFPALVHFCTLAPQFRVGGAGKAGMGLSWDADSFIH